MPCEPSTQTWCLQILDRLHARCSRSHIVNYIPHYTKKKQILARKRLALSRLVKEGKPLSKLLTSALAVRDAQIRVLRAQRDQIAPFAKNAHLFEKIDAKIAIAEQIPLEEILGHHGWFPNGRTHG